MDIHVVTVKANSINSEDREAYTEMGYDVNRAYLLPYKWEQRFKTLVETLKDFTDRSNAGRNFDICAELDFELKQLCRSLVYLLNSTSYRKGNKYYDFDKIEIDSKLGRKRGKYETVYGKG